jgi:hypothetical protein
MAATVKKQGKEVDDLKDRDPEVEINPSLGNVRYYAIERELAKQLRAYAQQQGVSAETLLNLWVQEKLAQEGL